MRMVLLVGIFQIPMVEHILLLALGVAVMIDLDVFQKMKMGVIISARNVAKKVELKDI